MKKLIIGLVLFSIFGCNQKMSSQTQTSETINEGQRQIKSIETSFVSLVQNGLHPIYPEVTVEKYNERGSLLESSRIRSGENKTVVFSDVYEYDSENRLVRFYEKKDSKIEKAEYYEYDESGNLIFSCKSIYEDIENEECSYSERYEYDNLGRKILCATTEKGEEELLFKFEYNANDSLVRKLQKISSEWFVVLEYEYDAEGNKVKITDDGLVGHTEFKYDSLGRVVLYQHFDESGNLILEEKTTYLNENGTTTEILEQFGREGELQWESRITYNSYGDIIEYSDSYVRFTYAYEYDKQGNWIKKTEFNGEEAQKEEVRKISYY